MPQLRLSYDLKSGKYSGDDLASGITVFKDAVFTVDEMNWDKPEGVVRKWSVEDVDDEFGKGRKLNIEKTPNGGYHPIKTLHITVYDGQPFAALGFSVTNQRKIPVRICRVVGFQWFIWRGPPHQRLQRTRGSDGVGQPPFPLPRPAPQCILRPR